MIRATVRRRTVRHRLAEDTEETDMTRTEQPTSRTRDVLSALGNGLSLGVLLLVLGVGVLTIAVPAALGGIPLTVLTGSMRPHLPPGTLVVATPTPAEEIAVGEVITYQLESGRSALVTHRVIARVTDSTSGEPRFITQGDANDAPDEGLVRPAQIRGTVAYALPHLGWANQALNGQTRSWAIPALTAALFAYAAWSFGAGLRDRVRKRSSAHRFPENSAHSDSDVPAPALVSTKSD